MAAIDLGMPPIGYAGFEEAKRQLDICNSCRYCAGYCPVWPALERRVDLSPADITHMANLCHDCRDCYLACMYTPPHEFGVNPPQVFAEARGETYLRFVWRAARLRRVSGPVAALLGFVGIGVLLVVLSLCTVGGSAFGSGSGSAYDVIRHDLLLVVVGAPAVFSVVVLALAAARYWRFTHGPMGDLRHLGSWRAAMAQALTLRHQAGADGGCAYPGDRSAAPSRRFFHQLVMIGFTLTIVSTISAGIEQYFFGLLPPYPFVSVPVLSGLVGGILQIVGCGGLIWLKLASDRNQTTPIMWRADFAFLWSLIVLNASGLLVLALRSTSIFGAVLVVHLASVVLAFGIAPYTKFVHFIFRTLAIYKNVLEEQAAPSA